MKTRFGECILDTKARTLVRAGVEVALTPKAFLLLEYLVERRPAAVSQNELRDAIWPKTSVGPTSLPRLVTELRQAIGDDSSPIQFLRTLRGFGYAFSADPTHGNGEGEAPKEGPAHRLFWKERSVILRAGENVLGRSSDAAVWIDAASVSRRHAVIVVDGETAVLRDLDSKNGTRVEGQLAVRPHRLSDGEEILLGRERVLYRFAVPEESTKSFSNSQ